MDASPARALPARRLLSAAPWIAILLIIASVQVVRGALVDAGIFAVVALLILIDATGLLPEIRAGRVPVPPILVGGGIALVLLALTPRHGVAAGVVVSAIGIAALAIAWPRPMREASRPRPRRILRGAVLWAGVTVVLCLWELSSFLLGRDDAAAKLAHPAISDLLDPLLDGWPGRAAFTALWLAAGVVFMRAGRRS